MIKYLAEEVGGKEGVSDRGEGRGLLWMRKKHIILYRNVQIKYILDFAHG